MRRLSSIYSGRIDISDLIRWPAGAIRDVISGVANSGTPLQQSWARQPEGFMQAVMQKAGFAYNGQIDDAVDNQILDGVEAIAARPTAYPAHDIYSVCNSTGRQWHDPSSDQNHVTPNQISAPGTAVFVDACIGRCAAPEGHLPAVLTLDTQGYIRRFTGFKDLTVEPSEENIPYSGMTFPSPLSAKVSILYDANAIYVAWIRLSDDHMMVSRYSMGTYTGSPEWTYDTGGSVASGLEEYCKLTNADGNYLALSLPVSVLGRNGVAIINKVTGVGVTGVGNEPGAETRPNKNGRIVSDGDHVFWVGCTGWGTGGTDDVRLFSARISDPTTSAYAAPIIASVDYDTQGQSIPTGIIAAGTDILISTADGQVYKFDKFLEDTALAMTVSNFSEKTGPITYSPALGWDDMNVWSVGVCVGDTLEACKLPGGMFTRGFSVTYPGESYQASKIGFSGAATVDAENEMGRLLFDGQCMWLVHRTDGIYRITAPGMR